MNGVNLQASLHNLSQMNRHQQDEHTKPVVNQEQNAEAAKENAAQRIDKPVEPEETEGKVVDPENKKKNGSRRRKKKKDGKRKKKKSPGNRGRFVDFSA
jgi:hypothetical protein